MRPVRLFVQCGECLTSVAVKIWALAAQLSCAGSSEVTSVPGCAPVVSQLPGSRSQSRCVWQVSLDLSGVVFGMGWVCALVAGVVGLLGENLPSQWNRMGFWSRPEHPTLLSLLREQDQAFASDKVPAQGPAPQRQREAKLYNSITLWSHRG